MKSVGRIATGLLAILALVAAWMLLAGLLGRTCLDLCFYAKTNFENGHKSFCLCDSSLAELLVRGDTLTALIPHGSDYLAWDNFTGRAAVVDLLGDPVRIGGPVRPRTECVVLPDLAQQGVSSWAPGRSIIGFRIHRPS